jgi:hypothetical protein
MHPVFDSISMCCRGIFNVLRAAFNVLRNFIISTSDVLRSASFFQRAAEIRLTTQCRSERCSTAALLSLKYLYIYICTYMHVRIGVSIDRRLKCCAPRLSVSA